MDVAAQPLGVSGLADVEWDSDTTGSSAKSPALRTEYRALGGGLDSVREGRGHHGRLLHFVHAQ